MELVNSTLFGREEILKITSVFGWAIEEIEIKTLFKTDKYQFKKMLLCRYKLSYISGLVDHD
jgi:hypothetical protein